MMLLHDFALSAEGYAVRLFAAFLGLDPEIRWIDVYPGRQDRDPAFLAISPRGLVPVLQDGGVRLDDWRAILVHLATIYDAAGRWRACDEATAAWLETAQMLADTAGVARLHDGMGVPADVEAARAGAHRIMRRIEAHLWWRERAGEGWIIAGAHPGLADMALFPFLALCEEGGVSRMDYPAIRRWIDRVRRLPGFIVTSGVFALPPCESPA